MRPFTGIIIRGKRIRKVPVPGHTLTGQRWLGPQVPSGRRSRRRRIPRTMSDRIWRWRIARAMSGRRRTRRRKRWRKRRKRRDMTGSGTTTSTTLASRQWPGAWWSRNRSMPTCRSQRSTIRGRLRRHWWLHGPSNDDDDGTSNSRRRSRRTKQSIHLSSQNVHLVVFDSEDHVIVLILRQVDVRGRWNRPTWLDHDIIILILREIDLRGLLSWIHNHTKENKKHIRQILINEFL
jgi:hypothetical protein